MITLIVASLSTQRLVRGIGTWHKRSHENKLQEVEVFKHMDFHKSLCGKLHHTIFCWNFLAWTQSWQFGERHDNFSIQHLGGAIIWFKKIQQCAFQYALHGSLPLNKNSIQYVVTHDGACGRYMKFVLIA